MDMSRSLPRRFLMSANLLREANFSPGIVLMLENTDHGPIGHEFNQPSSLTIRKVLSQAEAKILADDPVFAGSPVEPTPYFVLQNSLPIDKKGHEVPARLFLADCEDSLHQVVPCRKKPNNELQFYVNSGHAGCRHHHGTSRSIAATGSLSVDGTTVPSKDVELHWRLQAPGSLPQRFHRATRLLPLNVVNPDIN